MNKPANRVRARIDSVLNELTDEIAQAYAYADNLIAQRLEQGVAVFGRPFTCPSCTQGRGCCCQKVVVHMVEVLPLVRHLRRTGQQQALVRSQLRIEGELMEGTAQEPWFDQGRACVFLTPEQRCRIYAYRPMVCRIYHTWSPAADCQPPTHVRTVQRLSEDPALLQVMCDIEGVVQQQWELRTDRIFMGTLPRMTAIVLEALAQPSEQGFLQTLQQQPYPDPDNLMLWVGGINPFRRQAAKPG